MTNPLEGVTDAHLQAALNAAGIYSTAVEDVRRHWAGHPHIIAHARQIAANEKLAAELAELRAKLAEYEPEVVPVDPVEFAAHEIYMKWQGEWEIEEYGAACIRRGMEMQKAEAPEIELDWAKLSAAMNPTPFTREEAERIAHKFTARATDYLEDIIDALTTPRAELRAMLGDG